MKHVKIVEVHELTDGYYGEVISTSCQDITNWEEVDEETYQKLLQAFSGKRAQGNYVLIVQVEKEHRSINDFIAEYDRKVAEKEEKERIKRQAVEKRLASMKEKQIERKKKKLAKLLAEVNELER